MRHTIAALFLIAVTALGATTPFACVEDTYDQTTVTFTTPDFTLAPDADAVRIDLGQDYPPYGAGMPGTPDIPVFSKLVRIPAGASVEVQTQYFDEATYDNILLTPCRDLDAVEANDLSYSFDSAAYASNELFPANGAVLGETGVMRDAAVARVILHPFRYNAAERQLTVARRMQVTLRYTYEGQGPIPTLSGRGGSSFGELVDAVTLNPRHDTRSYNEPGSYIYVYNGDASILTWLQPLIDWRERQGYEVHLASMTQIGGSNIAIKAYLQSAYNNWENPPEYVCLVGDANNNYSVPTFFEYYDDQVYGDHPYSLLDGNDTFPDILVGRLTFNSLTELQIIVTKILVYEMAPPTNNDWIDRSLLLADTFDSGVSTLTTMLYIMGLLEDYNPGGDITLVHTSPLVTQMRNALNAGVGAFFYRGFGTFTNWDPEFTHQLTNYDMTPFMSAITCYTGNFCEPEDCDIEVFLKAGTPSTRIGAVGVIGSSSATHTCFNNIITAGIAEGIYMEGMHSFAAALDRGKLALYESYPTNPNEFVDWYTIGKNFLGDPGCWLRTHHADSLFVVAADTVPLGSNSFPVTVVNEFGERMGNVWVTARSGDNMASAWTDANGEAVIFYDASATGTVNLTASMPDCVPWLGDFTVAEESDYLTFESYDANAALFGGDHVIDVCMRNTGTTNLPGASAVVRINDPYFTLGDSLLSFGAVNAGQTISSTNTFTGTLANDTPSGHVINVELLVSTAWDPYPVWFEMPVDMLSCELDWTFSSPHPGQSGTLNLTLENTSPCAIGAPIATVECLSPEVTITSDQTGFGNIGVDQSAAGQSAITFDLALDYTPGAPVTFIVTIVDEPELYKVVHIDDISFATDLPNIPTGPDDYGYWIYDTGDVGYLDTPTYDWVEIDPDHGGAGVSHNVTDNDYNGSGDVVQIDLPFNFRMYENGYDRISISTNGFIIPGDRVSIEWMNWPIPGPMVPRPIIAPFWDDLIVGAGSNLCTMYDQANHRYIIEWSRFLNRYDNSEETFQVILYDPQYNATYLGDSKILYQYETVNNVDQGTYLGFELDHGEYSTVGIGDHTGLRGVSYTHSNQYAEGAATLANGLALMISGPPSAPSNPYLVLGDITATDTNGNSNGLIDNGETIELAVELCNLGLETGENVTAQLIEDDPYLTVSQAVVSYPDLDGGASGWGEDEFVLDIADNCPNEHLLNVRIRIVTNYETREVAMALRTYAPAMAYNSMLFVDGNDNQLAPGEAGSITFHFDKTSYHDLADVVVTPSSETSGVSFLPHHQNVGAVSEDAFSVEFTIMAADSVANGSDIEINLTSTHDGAYEQVDSVPFVIGEIEQFIYEDFNDGFDDFWQTSVCALGNDNIAGGDGQEALFIGDPVDQRILLSRTQDPSDIMKFIFEFDHRNIGSGTVYGVLMQELPSGDVHIAWIDTANMEQAEHAHVEFIPTGGFQNEWLMALLLNPTQNSGDQQWAVDNLDVKIIRHDPAIISGHVSLDGGAGNVEDVTVNVFGFPNVHPDENGYYEVEVTEGIYWVSYSLSGYTTHTEENLIVTYEDQPVIDVELEYLPGPTNLQYSLEGDEITLTWEYGDNTFINSRNLTKREETGPMRPPAVEYFDVTLCYRENFFYHSYPVDTTYSRDIISAGTYEFWVQARYVSGAMSAESNHVEFEIHGVGEPTPEFSFGLQQNRPNPFNPETTIAYSLAQDAADCRIELFNIRGERVRRLVEGPCTAGMHTVVWDGRDDSGNRTGNGVYFYRLTANGKTDVRKAVLLK